MVSPHTVSLDINLITTVMTRIIIVTTLLIPSVLLMILIIRNMKIKPKDSVYISGKVTDVNSNWVWIKFKISEIYLRIVGFSVYNPISHLTLDATYEEFENVCLKALEQCDFIYFQYDWIRSLRTRQEFNRAARLRKMLANTGKKIHSMFDSVASIY